MSAMWLITALLGAYLLSWLEIPLMLKAVRHRLLYFRFVCKNHGFTLSVKLIGTKYQPRRGRLLSCIAILQFLCEVSEAFLDMFCIHVSLSTWLESLSNQITCCESIIPKEHIDTEEDKDAN